MSRSVVALALALCAGIAFAEAPRLARVDVIPLGAELSADDTEAVRAALATFYGVEVRVRPTMKLPREAWYAPRKRWRADKILEVLAALPPDDSDRILGLTGVDISTTKGDVHDWGVLGLGSIDGRTGVLSRFRCDRAGKNPKLARERLAKVAVHELGHTLGLPHCPNHGCIMEDAEGKVATADGEYDLCAHCRSLLAERGYKIPATPSPPWPKP